MSFDDVIPEQEIRMWVFDFLYGNNPDIYLTLMVHPNVGVDAVQLGLDRLFNYIQHGKLNYVPPEQEKKTLKLVP